VSNHHAGGKGCVRRPAATPITDDAWSRIFGSKSPPKNVRHDIDPTLVAAQIEAKVAEYRRYYGGVTTLPKSEPDAPDAWADKAIALERQRYALVRVIELPKTGNRFVLVYSDQDDAAVTEGTGPFESFEVAASWFLKGGR